MGGGAKAGELPRRVGWDRRRAQLTGRATVHGPPCGLPNSRSGPGEATRRSPAPSGRSCVWHVRLDRRRDVERNVLGMTVPTWTPALSSAPAASSHGYWLASYHLHKYRRNLLTEVASVAIQVA